MIYQETLGRVLICYRDFIQSKFHDIRRIVVRRCRRIGVSSVAAGIARCFQTIGSPAIKQNGTRERNRVNGSLYLRSIRLFDARCCLLQRQFFGRLRVGERVRREQYAWLKDLYIEVEFDPVASALIPIQFHPRKTYRRGHFGDLRGEVDVDFEHHRPFDTIAHQRFKRCAPWHI